MDDFPHTPRSPYTDDDPLAGISHLPPLTGPAELLERLADLDGVDYDQQRKAAAAELGGIRLNTLDKMVEEIRLARASAAAAAAAAAQRKQPPSEPPEDTAEVKALIAEFNALYFVVNLNGQAAIYAPKHDPDQNRRFYERIEFDALAKLYLNRAVLTGYNEKTGTPIYKRVAQVWLQHSKRRQYIGGIVFDPSSREHPASVLNLWESFAVQAKAGSWAKLQDHIRDVICDGDPIVFAYLLDWMADLMQHPEKQGEVAVVLRGEEGSGKGILARALKYLLGQHGIHISNAKHLTGNFNAHLRDAVFLFADEAFFAGDRAHVGVLNTLVTEPTLMIEAKYQNAAQTPNRLHIMMASNEDWVVPARLRSRRWLMLDVSADKVGDHAYFAAIVEELEHGGYEAMLHDLLNRDISKSNLRAVPVTDALQTQRKRSLDTMTAWWVDCLHRGHVFASKLGLEDHWANWHIFLPTEVLYASYIQYCRDHHDRYPQGRELFGKWIKSSTGANAGRMHNQAIGEHIVDAVTTDGRTSRIAELVKSPYPRGYTIGTLDEARKAFSSFSGLDIEWE